MKIIVVGAGEVGTHLAKLLSKENINIILMDEEAKRIENLEENYDLLTKVGSPTSIESLKECGVADTELFIAVTPYESVNMTACMLASKMGAKKTLARVENQEYLIPEHKEFFATLGVDHLICPEQLATREILESLNNTWLRQRMSFAQGELVLLGIKIRQHAPIVKHLLNSNYFAHNNYRIVAIKRKDKTIIPGGNDAIQDNDVVYFITTPEKTELVREEAGKTSYTIKNLIAMGGSRITQQALKSLQNNTTSKIMERNKERCMELVEKLHDSLIINADARNIDSLIEEGIEDADAFLALTSNSEMNILSCLAAKRLGVKKTVAEVENIDYISLAEDMGIGTVINKKMIAAGYIYQLTLDADVLEVRNLTSADAEVVEFIAKEGAKITKSPIKKIKLPKYVNIGGYVRNGEGQIVFGNTQIEPGDHVLVFCINSSIRKIESYFN